jgi:ankyrin repeat protein
MSEETLEDYLHRLADCEAGFESDNPVTVYSRSRVRDTPLHWAVINGELEIVKLMIKAGADLDAIGEDGYRPVHEAISHKRLEILKILLDSGASCETDQNGESIEWMIEDHKEYAKLIHKYQSS